MVLGTLNKAAISPNISKRISNKLKFPVNQTCEIYEVKRPLKNAQFCLPS